MEERTEAEPGLVTKGCIMVSDGMLIYTLFVLVEALEMSCAEAIPQACDL